MFPTAARAANHRPMRPNFMFYKEAIPLVGKNAVQVRRQRIAGSACTTEMQALFSCLKKWEYDDLPCSKFHDAYMRCVEESEKDVQKYKEAVKKGVLGDESSAQLTAAQLNKIMKLYPQPDLGTFPYRVMKRLPTVSYADDIFRRKNKPGKPS